MRSKDTNVESSRDILRKIEESVLLSKKKLTEDKTITKILQIENYYLDLFLKNTNNLNHLTYFNAIEKTQNPNIKW